MIFDPDLIRQVNSAGFEFLLRDIEIAFTFLQIAQQSDGDSEKRFRNQANAQKAYDKVQQLAGRLYLTPQQQGILVRQLAELKATLEQFGDRVSSRATSKEPS